MKKWSKRLIVKLGFVLALILSLQAMAADGFIVRDIKITGLKRVSTGTVLNYLPVQMGEEVDAASTPQIIRALYDTGFFQSVVLERQGRLSRHQ